MKNLKMRFTAFGLMALFVLSLFMTSCEQEAVQSAVTDELSPEETLGLKLSQDERMDDFIQTINEIHSIMATSIQESGISQDELMNLIQSGSEDEFNQLFSEEERELMESKMEKFKNLQEAIVIDYPEIAEGVEKIENINTVVDEALLSDYYNFSLNHNEISDRWLDGICDVSSDCGWGYGVCVVIGSAGFGVACAGVWTCAVALGPYYYWVFSHCTSHHCNSDCQ